MPLARIKRFGNQFASCGIPVRPPEDLVGQSGIKRRCPKLVPGQVINLPEDHTLFDQECIEIVRRVGHDEILRPWVFATADEAMRANPNKQGLTHDQIQGGLTMAQGAIDNAERNRAKAKAAVEEFDVGEELEDPRRTAQRSRNRVAQDIYDDAKPVRDGPEEEEDEVAPRSGGRRKRDAVDVEDEPEEEVKPKSRRRQQATRRG